MTAVEQTADGIRLRIMLQPKASKDAIIGLHDEELKNFYYGTAGGRCCQCAFNQISQ